ncbi:MAG: type II CAAX endopeptidase family protein [Methanobacteriaceae archaeon]|nr:type II CAAX endopeptidase family protein [Methanobacteriaceae archaeon]
MSNSNILFLDNAKLGKNNWWRYLITIILSLLIASVVAGALLGVFIVIGILIFKQSFNVDLIYQLLEEPIFLIFLVGLSFSISFIFLYLCTSILHKKEFISLINTKNKVRWNRIAKGAGAWLFIIAAFDLLSYFIGPTGFKISFNFQKFWILVILALIAFPIQASFEEVFFRGYLMQGISLIFKKPVWVLLISALTFSLLHWWNAGTVIMSISIVMSTFIIGLVLGIIVLADNGIEMAMGVHIINNFYVSVIHSSPEGGLGNLPSIFISNTDPYTSPIFLGLAAIILIYVLFINKIEDVLKIFKN